MTATFIPPNPPEPLRPLDLAQQKGIGALITSAWRIWKARPGVFLSTALVVGAVPLALFAVLQELVTRSLEGDDARWERIIETGKLTDGDVDVLVGLGGAFVIGMIITGLVVPAIVTATHARAVVALASGDDLTRQQALRRGLSVLGPIIWATLVWSFATVLGMLLFVIPGLYVSLAGSFAPMLVALSLGKGWGALKESMRLVRAAGWWRTFGYVFVVNLVAAAVLFIPAGIFGGIASAIDTTAASVVSGIVQGLVQAVMMSWSALATTLIFFSWKSRIGEAWVRPEGSAPIDIPGGGGDAPPPQAGGGWGQPAPPTPPTGPTFVRPGDLPRQ